MVSPFFVLILGVLIVDIGVGKYCQDMADSSGIMLAKLYELNPALGGDCSGLWAGYAYCIRLI
jgi:hypothetical protein